MSTYETQLAAKTRNETRTSHLWHLLQEWSSQSMKPHSPASSAQVKNA